MISSESPHPLPGPFSEIQCDKFRSQNAPHSWITVRDRDVPRDCVAEWRLRVEFLFKTDSGYPRDACGRCDVDMGQVRDTKVHVTLSLMR
jgi:hypothetical protein